MNLEQWLKLQKKCRYLILLALLISIIGVYFFSHASVIYYSLSVCAFFIGGFLFGISALPDELADEFEQVTSPSARKPTTSVVG